MIVAVLLILGGAMLVRGSYVGSLQLPRAVGLVQFPGRAVAAGNIAATTIVTAPASSGAGIYRAGVYAAPTTADAAATVLATIRWTENGTAKSRVLPSLALLALGNVVQETIVLYVDAGAVVSIEAVVVGAGGNFDLRAVAERTTEN
jgi:hypothetical protein